MASTRAILIVGLGVVVVICLGMILVRFALPGVAKTRPVNQRRPTSSRPRPNANPDFPVPPDTRPPGCDPVGESQTSSVRTKVSIVIPYLNESWEFIKGTVLSILHFTPDDLIEQIIFVSDGNRSPRNDELEALSPKIRVLVLHKRHGLIRAKMKGMELVTAPVVVFLEPHCIMNQRWLEPLIAHIEEYPRSLAMPVLDAIPQDNFKLYQRAAVGHFRLEWNFNLIYTAPAILEDSSKIYPSPATSGGIFAIRSEWFRHLELFDVGMRQWGGDHVELTMKAWRCGGQIDIVPCSRVGHMFRDSLHQPYAVKVQQIVRNYARLANIWTDQHINAFFKVKPEAKAMDTGDVSNLLKQREKLSCRSMDWYLKHVDFELGWEVSRICIPGASRQQGGCRGKAVIGRSTIDQLMPVEAYLKARAFAAPDESSGKVLALQAPGAPSTDSEDAMPREAEHQRQPATRDRQKLPVAERAPAAEELKRPPLVVVPLEAWNSAGDQRWEAAIIADMDDEEDEL